MIGLETPSKLKLLSMEGKKSKRIDKELYSKETQSLADSLRVLNTLYDIKLADNSTLIAGEKSAEEQASENVVDIDDEEEVKQQRTIIANVNGSSQGQEFEVELDQTLAQLKDFLKGEFNLDGEGDEFRLRDVGKGRLLL